jgi:hypothetical protein
MDQVAHPPAAQVANQSASVFLASTYLEEPRIPLPRESGLLTVKGTASCWRFHPFETCNISQLGSHFSCGEQNLEDNYC